MTKRLTTQDIEAIRKRAEAAIGNRSIHAVYPEKAFEVLDEDIPALLAEVERLRAGIEVVIKETQCDDTWDYLNRILDGEAPLGLLYRIGGKTNDSEA